MYILQLITSCNSVVGKLGMYKKEQKEKKQTPCKIWYGWEAVPHGLVPSHDSGLCPHCFVTLRGGD